MKRDNSMRNAYCCALFLWLVSEVALDFGIKKREWEPALQQLHNLFFVAQCGWSCCTLICSARAGSRSSFCRDKTLWWRLECGVKLLRWRYFVEQTEINSTTNLWFLFLQARSKAKKDEGTVFASIHSSLSSLTSDDWQNMKKFPLIPPSSGLFAESWDVDQIMSLGRRHRLHHMTLCRSFFFFFFFFFFKL